MKNKYKLGILLKNGKIVNHRSLLKVLINPILRYFGFQIGSIFDKKNKFVKYTIARCKRNDKLIWYFKSWNEHDEIILKRILF